MFKIEITEIVTQEETKGNEWTVLRKNADGSEEKGYSPAVVFKNKVAVNRLSQSVDQLDLVGVIKAINGI